ncbi:MAG: hypothetical protein K6G65_10045 [Lachnospiraceae bacterium]|nr:hypothetical protein [Lachnospiraceae bacterium]
MRKKRLDNLKQYWGVPSKEVYSKEQFSKIEKYFVSKHKDDYSLDQVTWDDLDMDSIFSLLNHTSSSIGEEYLYDVLHRQMVGQGELDQREQLILLFESEEDIRYQTMGALRRMGKTKKISIFEYIMKSQERLHLNPKLDLFCGVGFLGSFISLFQSFGSYKWKLPLFVFFVAFNIISYYRKKAKVFDYMYIYAYILRMMDAGKSILKLEHEILAPYQQRIKSALKGLGKFQRGSFLVQAGNFSGDPLDIFMDYLRMLLHFDLLKLVSMGREIGRHQYELVVLYEELGKLDAMISVAGFREYLKGDYSIPVFLEQKNPFLAMEELYHPLILHPVKNSIVLQGDIMLTGSNASGKSTFLKAVAINAILAQTINTALAKKYEGVFFKTVSSMSIRDNILYRESYYVAEIKNLKRILDGFTKEVPTLCFIDEVLRGTNTIERISAASEILKKISTSNAVCLVATHDGELTKLCEDYYTNYHFSEKIEEGDVVFDYCLKPGVATSSNAIRLLEAFGFDSDIIEAAKARMEMLLHGG